jgi:dihydropyrimidinase
VTSDPQFDVIVRGGKIVTAEQAFLADIGISAGKIVGIAERPEDAPRIIQARGRLILPGGVDAHCHMDQPSYGGA